MTGGARTPPAAPSTVRVALLVGTLVALTIVGSSAVAVALPTVAADLQLDTAGTAWVLAVFSLSFSVATALFGRLADLRGLRLPLRIGVVLLVGGSLATAAAWSFPSLVVGRLVQGFGAGAVPVLATGIVVARFEGDARARALGALTAVVSLVSGSGPLIGGAIAHLLGWRAVLAVPAIAALLVEPVARIAPVPVRGDGRLDVRGALLVAATVTGVTLLLQAPATRPGPLLLTAAALLAVGGGVGVVASVRAVPSGFLPRVVVTNPAMVLAAVTGLVVLAAYLAMLLALPLLLSQRHGWSALQIGLALLPAALAGAVVSRIVGGAIARLGAFRLAAWLALGSAAGALLAAASADSPPLLVVGMALVVCGFAGGQVALLDAIPRLVPARVRGAAIGVFNLVFFVGGAIGSAATGGLAGRVGVPAALAVVALLPAVGAVTAVLAGRQVRRAGVSGSPRR